jgi:hypothetical protein
LNKSNSKWIKDLNIRPETLKLLEKNIRETLEDTDISKSFWNRTPIAQKIKIRIQNGIALN